MKMRMLKQDLKRKKKMFLHTWNQQVMLTIVDNNCLN